jgi:hypothetical protein
MKGTRIRHLALALALAAFGLLVSSDVDAQQRLIPHLSAGIAVGTGDLGHDTGNGWFVLGGVDLPLLTPGLTIGPVLGYGRIPYDGGFGETESITAMFGEVGYVTDLAALGPVQPYLRGGGGLHIHRYDPGDIPTQATTLSLGGFSAGAGVTVGFGSAVGFVGGRFMGSASRGFVGLHAGFMIR